MVQVPLLKVRYFHFLLFLLAFLLFDCNGDVKEEEVKSVYQNEFQSYQLDINKQSTPLAKLIKTIEITRFEETSESLLGNVRQVEFIDDKMIVPGRKGNIHVFSDAGDFIKNINRKGDGPEEYRFWNDIWVEGDTVCLFQKRRGVLRYDLNGTFIAAVSFSLPATHVHPYSGGYALDMNYARVNDTLQYAIVTLNNDLEVDQLLLPYKTSPKPIYSMPWKTVFPLGNEVFVFPVMKDTVYRLSEGSIEPAIHYDFGEDWFIEPDKVLTGSFSDDFREKGKVWWINNYLSERYIFLSTTVGVGGRAQYFINRENGQSVMLDRKLRSGEDFSLTGIKWDGDEFLFTMPSSQLHSLVDQLSERQYSYTSGTSLEEIESSENPVLLRISLKDIK